jgi:hypothetical protein
MERPVSALHGMRGDLVEPHEAVLKAVAGFLGGLISITISVEDYLLAHPLAEDLAPSRPVRVVGNDTQ